jgi:MFS family permease
VTHGFGFGVFALVNYALAFWIPALFVRTYGWSAGTASIVQGMLTMTVGVAGVVCGGWLGDRLIARGRSNGPMIVGIVGAAGMFVSATAFTLMPTAALAVAALAVVNFFAAFPWGAASAAAAEMAPTALRAQAAALYFFVLTLVSGTLGPVIVGVFNERVFGPDRIQYSLAATTAGGMLVAVLLLAAGLGSYERTLAYRDVWMEQ